MSDTNINLLLVEDNPADAYLIRQLLAQGTKDTSPFGSNFLVHHAPRIADALAYLDQYLIDVILLDLSLPDGQGLETFEKIKMQAGNIPIVVLSGLDDETVSVKAMQQGAPDYLVKGDIETELLTRAIRYAIERQTLVTEQMEARSQLTRQAIELQNRNAELDEFAHTVAHQVQGLLGQIIGYSSFLEMIYMDEIEEEGQFALKHILASGYKMNNVLSEILLLASVGRDDIKTTPLDMGRIAAEAQKRLSFDIKECGAEITQSEDWPVAVGYTSWIEEVWVNYISNALKYGGDPPKLQLGATPGEDGMICFWVQDNGMGISKVDQQRLFKAHTRLHQTRARGEGLGLSIVRRIVKKCGGEVGVESELGAGSTFWFTLPEAGQ